MNKTRKNISTGLVLEIQRMSTEDGPGIRTTVFLKGCSLECAWCHNPESISTLPQVQWIENRCIGCEYCVKACPVQALKMTDSGIVIDRETCTGCGICAEECPSTAMELLGTSWNADDLVAELAKDRAYFEQSGGGITIGGGEVCMQTPFAMEVLRGIKKLGIHTAIDTCGQTSAQNLDRLLPLSDMVLYDLKDIDPDMHRKYTGSSNERVLENAIHVCAYIRDHLLPVEMWVRTPVIPGATAREENIKGIGRFIAENLGGCVTRWELLAFNNLCRDKYIRLYRDWPFSDTGLLTKDEMERLAEIASNSGVDPSIVHWSGSTRLEERAGNTGTGPDARSGIKKYDACSAPYMPLEDNK